MEFILSEHFSWQDVIFVNDKTSYIEENEYSLVFVYVLIMKRIKTTLTIVILPRKIYWGENFPDTLSQWVYNLILVSSSSQIEDMSMDMKCFAIFNFTQTWRRSPHWKWPSKLILFSNFSKDYSSFQRKYLKKDLRGNRNQFSSSFSWEKRIYS